MATQTGSIDLKASNQVQFYAKAGFESAEQTYATQSALTVQADRIGMVVQNTDATSSLQLTANAMSYIGSNVTITDEAGTSTVISGGKLHADQIAVGDLSDGSDYSTTTAMNSAIATAKSTAISTAATDATTKANNAAKTATNYLTTITGTSGISVHDAGDTSNYVNITSGVIDLVTGGISRLKAWVDNTVAKVRVGIESAGHAIFSPSGMEVFTDATTSVASFGSTARIGQAAKGRVEVTDSAITMYSKYSGSYYETFKANVVGGTSRVTTGAVYADGGSFTSSVSTPAIGSLDKITTSVSSSDDYNVVEFSSGTVTVKYQNQETAVNRTTLTLDTSGNLTVPGTLTGGIAGNFATTWHTIVDASSVAAGGYLSGSLAVTKSGYIPLGIVGQTSDMRYVTFVRAYIGSPADGSGTVQWMVYNPTTSAKTPTMQVVVLWAKS